MHQRESSILAELRGEALVSVPDIRSLFIETSEQNPNVEAVVSPHQRPLGLDGLDSNHQEPILRWSYSQLHRGATHLASKLEACGVRKGSSIAFFCENRAEWVLFCWTAVLLGCPFVPLNPRLSKNEEELNYVLAQISPSVIVVVDENVISSLEMNAAREIKRACLRVSLDSMETPTGGTNLPWISLKGLWPNTPHQGAHWEGKIFKNTTIIGFTSGTTSHPKACPQSSENLMTSAVAIRDLRKLGPTDRLCQHLPGFAAMAILISLTCGISGAAIVYPSSSFSATATLDAIESEKCTYTFAAPAIVRALAMHPSIAGRSLGSLRIVELGGAPIYPEILQLAAREYGLNCERVGCGWGMTESPCPLLAEPWERGMTLPTDYIPVGKPIPGTHAKICATGSQTPVRRGEVGELHVGGPQIVQGYLNSNNEVFYSEDGIRWIKTGDMARIDDGQVYIVGRFKDIIIRGGHNISPAKIERYLEKVPSVEAQVVGMPDDLAGEVPIAVLKLSGEAATSPKSTIQRVRELALKDLGPTETPHAYLPLDELGLDNFPATLSGKVQKAKLAKIVLDYLNHQNSSPHSIPNASTTETILLELWSKVSGVAVSAIDPKASVFTFVDSITTMRLSTLVKKQLQRDLTVDDVTSHPSIYEQAKLLDTRTARSTTGLLNLRPGPPTVKDMVHCQGKPDKAALTEKLATPLLQKLGLSWDDVEDVFAAPDTSYTYLNRQRPQTWNQRMIYLAPNTNVETLNQAWKAILIHHAVFRTLAISTAPESNTFGEAKHFFLVLRPNEGFWKCSITLGLEVERHEDLRTTFLNEWADSLTGPLIRVAFINVKSTASSAFVLVGNHTAYDNLSMDLLFSDLETALSHNLTKENILAAPGHIPFKRFADRYFEYRTTPEALEAATFHANRLRGISAEKASLWPKSRAPGWFKGQADGWTFPDGTPGDSTLRQPIDTPGHCHGLDGLTRTAPITTLQAMKEKYGIHPHIILKVAIALFNMKRTGTTNAIFANVEAGRKWPTDKSEKKGEEEKEKDTENPLAIAGPMFQVALNRISLSDHHQETVLDLLRRVSDEQILLTTHSQAPLFLIKSILGREDGDALFEALARQGYNWAPGIQASSRSAPQSVSAPALVKFNRQAFDDIGLAWTCGLQDSSTFYVNASYDDCQLGRDEVYEALGEVLCAGVWLADPGNAGKGVESCCFQGYEVSGLIRSLE